jgi:hypothetical protein
MAGVGCAQAKQSIVGSGIRCFDMNVWSTRRRRRADCPASDIEIGNTAGIDDGVEMLGQRSLTGVHGSEMQEPNIDAAGFARIETYVEYFPCAPECGAWKELLAEHRMPEGLRFAYQ